MFILLLELQKLFHVQCRLSRFRSFEIVLEPLQPLAGNTNENPDNAVQSIARNAIMWQSTPRDLLDDIIAHLSFVSRLRLFDELPQSRRPSMRQVLFDQVVAAHDLEKNYIVYMPDLDKTVPILDDVATVLNANACICFNMTLFLPEIINVRHLYLDCCVPLIVNEIKQLKLETLVCRTVNGDSEYINLVQLAHGKSLKRQVWITTHDKVESDLRLLRRRVRKNFQCYMVGELYYITYNVDKAIMTYYFQHQSPIVLMTLLMERYVHWTRIQK